MKLTESYLCPDCGEVFSPDRSLVDHVKNPECPKCCNRFNLSLGKTLNRRMLEPPPQPMIIIA